MPKLITLVLCDDQLFTTLGSNTVWTADIYDLPQVRELGPMIKQVRAHYVADAATAAFQAKVNTAWSALGKVWSGPTEILGAQTGSKDGVMSAYLTTDSAFGLLMRYAIEVKNDTGTAIESARLTVVLEIELKS